MKTQSLAIILSSLFIISACSEGDKTTSPGDTSAAPSTEAAANETQAAMKDKSMLEKTSDMAKAAVADGNEMGGNIGEASKNMLDGATDSMNAAMNKAKSMGKEAMEKAELEGIKDSAKNMAGDLKSKANSGLNSAKNTLADAKDKVANLDMANPASEQCVKKGGTLKTNNIAGKDVTMCEMPDGKSIEEWEALKGGNN